MHAKVGTGHVGVYVCVSTTKGSVRLSYAPVRPSVYVVLSGRVTGEQFSLARSNVAMRGD